MELHYTTIDRSRSHEACDPVCNELLTAPIVCYPFLPIE